LLTSRIRAGGPDSATGFKLDGRLTADEGPELLRVCAGLTGRVVRYLIQFADRQGVRVLRELRAQGAELTGASPYLRLLLDGR